MNFPLKKAELPALLPVETQTTALVCFHSAELLWNSCALGSMGTREKTMTDGAPGP